jgi:hypothetical protein
MLFSETIAAYSENYAKYIYTLIIMLKLLCDAVQHLKFI